MKPLLVMLLSLPAAAIAEISVLPESESPTSEVHIVLNIDRDPTMFADWKRGAYPKIEITKTRSKRILASFNYFGDIPGGCRPLRQRITTYWRHDSQAVAFTIHDRHFSHSVVFVSTDGGRFKEIGLPSYEAVTGYKLPDSKHLRPRGRAIVEGWDTSGLMIYYIHLSPAPSYQGDDPLEHRVLLHISPDRITRMRSLDLNGA